MIEPDRRRGAGPTSYDDEWTTRRCDACGLEVDDPPHTMHPDLVAGLDDLARQVVAGAAAPGAPCRACAGPTRVVAVRRHTFVREGGRDLVLAWSAAAPEGVALAWSTPAGDEPAEPGPALDGWLARDAALRHVQACQAVFQDGRALAAARGLVERHAGDPALLDLLPRVVRLGADGWALALAVTRGAAAPGPAARALAVAALEVAPTLAPAALDEARALVEAAAAAVDDAPLLRARLLRAAGAVDAARAAFAAVAAAAPGCAEAHAALGDLSPDPAAALEHHTRAEAAAPDDADHPLGRARALLRLGRLDEAAAAAARARGLDRDHARLPRVEHELRRRRGEEPTSGPRVVLEAVGLDAWGETALERGVLPLADEAAGPEDAVRDLACALGLVQGSILARAPDGRPLRLFVVQGDGRCAELAPLDDPEAVALFSDEFAALWAEET